METWGRSRRAFGDPGRLGRAHEGGNLGAGRYADVPPHLRVHRPTFSPQVVGCLVAELRCRRTRFVRRGPILATASPSTSRLASSPLATTMDTGPNERKAMGSSPRCTASRACDETGKDL